MKRLIYPQNCKPAFTLAEVLIVLGIIGTLSMILIPTVVSNTNQKELETSMTVANAKLLEAMSQMRVKEKLDGYESTEAFVKEFKHFVKVSKVCDVNSLTKCFASQIKDEEGNVKNVADLKTGRSLLP